METIAPQALTRGFGPCIDGRRGGRCLVEAPSETRGATCENVHYEATHALVHFVSHVSSDTDRDNAREGVYCIIREIRRENRDG